MKKIYSDYRRFNANPKGNYIGDCSVRALCIAYGLTYESVHNELNRIKRERGYNNYCDKPVIDRFIKNKGFKDSGGCAYFGCPDNSSVQEVSEILTEGTWLLYTCDANKDRPDHIICMIDGDYWDSWNSSTQKVITIILLDENNTSDRTLGITIHDVEAELDEFLTKYLDKIHKKCPYFEFQTKRTGVHDESRYSMTLVLSAIEDLLPEGARFYRALYDRYTVSCKINPRMSREDNLSNMKSKLQVGFREFVYKHRKTVEDYARLSTTQLNKKLSTNNERVILSLPEWCRSLITYLYDEPDYLNKWGNRFDVYMEALPDDPDQDPVQFYADTIAELKNQLEQYKNDFTRRYD